MKKMIAERVPLFEYAGGYTGSDGEACIRCKTCGTEIVRSMVTIRHSHVRCETCYNAEVQERQRRRKEEQQAEILKRQKEKAAAKERALWSMTSEQMAFRVCPVCGGVFTSNNPRQKTCGGDCTRKMQGRKDRRVKRRRVLKDRDITLEGLFRRDHGICYLCGVECDWDNIETREDGTKIAGDWYPSIDHVRPLSKGGLHAWDNVRLAHRICNYLKSDKEIAPEKN